jgi:hypothetical protein
MLEIILLIFLTKNIGVLAERKGLSPVKWKWITVGAWVVFELIGLFLGIIMFGQDNLVGLMLFGIVCAFGGYLAVKYNLDKRPDNLINDDIDSIGRAE